MRTPGATASDTLVTPDTLDTPVGEIGSGGSGASAGPATRRRLRDPRELAALAHPVRLGIIELLVIGGPQTATELGEQLGESPANCSWHLRKLAEHGFVEASDGGRGRRRPWQVTGVGFTIGGADSTAEERLASRGLQRMFLERYLDRYHASVEALEHDDPCWREAAGEVQSATWLTVEELREVNAEIWQVLERHLPRLTDPSSRPADSRLCEFVAWGVPIELGGDPGTGPGAAAGTGTGRIEG